MPYWTNNRYPQMAINLRQAKPVSRLLLIGLIVTLLSIFSSVLWAEASLSPYHATYSSTIKGISAELKQNLEHRGANLRLINNSASVLFVGFKEQAEFVERNGKVISKRYDYRNKMSSRRNSSLRFDWHNNTVTDIKHKQPPLAIPKGTMDMLSFHVQLRLDLINNPQFTEKNYSLVESSKLKTYTVTHLGEELINTPVGEYKAVKLKQQRPGKNKHTLIWLAKEKEYLLLRLQRIEKGQVVYQVNLDKAELAGKKLGSS